MCKSRAVSLPCNKRELQISKEENQKERSLLSLPRVKAAKESDIHACNSFRE